MPRKATRTGACLKIELKVTRTTHLRFDMELRNGKVLLQFSPEAMATVQDTQALEKAKLLSQQDEASTAKPTLYQRAQLLTRGYLWLVVASIVLICAAGVLLFPQKAWNRVMMTLFGCVTLNIRGKAYRFCEQPPVQEHGAIPL